MVSVRESFSNLLRVLGAAPTVIAALLCIFILTPVEEALSDDLEPLLDTTESQLSGLDGELQIEPSCLKDLILQDQAFAAVYAELAASLQDPEKIPVLILYRTECTENCTRGELWMDGKRLCYTLELPDKNNQPNISCIPTGTYVCQPYSSAKFKDVYEILNVEDRYNVLLHWGNTTADTHGCPLLGKIKTAAGIGQSRAAVEAVRKVVGKCNFKLTITKGSAPTPTATPKPKKRKPTRQTSDF